MITTEQAIAWAREVYGDFNPDERAKANITALCNLAYAKGVEDAGKWREPVVWQFKRGEQPAMGWTVDYGVIREIAETIGDSDFHPGYEGVEEVLLALEKLTHLHPAPKGKTE